MERLDFERENPDFDVFRRGFGSGLREAAQLNFKQPEQVGMVPRVALSW